MRHELLVAGEVAERTSRAHRVVRPGDPVPESVVLTTEGSMAAWGNGAATDALWIVLGTGASTADARPFLKLPSGCSDAHLDSAIEAALEVLALRERLNDQRRETAIARERQVDLVRVGIVTAERDLTSSCS
jgi:hypothetical protein